MPVLRELITRIGFQVDDAGLRAAENRIRNFSRELNNYGRKMTMFVSLPLAGVAALALKTSSNIEGLRVSFETLLGSVSAADKLIRDLIEFAARTPFQLPEVQKMAGQLLAVGVESEKIIPTMKALGDVVAGTGADFGRVLWNLGQVKSQTYLTGRDLRDFTRNLIPMSAMLSKVLGVSSREVAEMVSKRKISFEMVMKAFEAASGEGGKFTNLMEKRSRTLAGRWSNLIDIMTFFFDELGKAITKTLHLKEALEFLTKAMGVVAKWLSETSPRVKTLIILFGAFLAILGPLMIAVASLTLLMVTFNATVLLIPALIAAAMIMLGLLIEDIYTWVKGGESLTGDLLGPWESWRDGLKMIFDEVGQFIEDFFFSILTGKGWQNIIDKLNNFVFIIKDVIKSFIADIENLFGKGTGKFLRWLLGGAYQYAGKVAAEEGAMYGAAAGAPAARALAGGAGKGGGYFSFDNQFNINIAGGTPEEQLTWKTEVRKFLDLSLVKQVRNAISQSPESE